MVVSTVYPAYVPSYASRESYITTDEYISAPTGTDLTQIVPGKDSATNKAALAGVIRRASSGADIYCRQVLAATQAVQAAPPAGWLIQNRGGRRTVWVPVKYTPVIEVNGVSLGWDPSTITALTDLTGVWPTEKVIIVPVPGTGLGAACVTGGGGNRMWGSLAYVHGWYNALTAANATAGASTVTTTDTLGLYPGLSVTIYDAAAANVETVTVATTYTPGSTTVPLTAPLTYNHAAGTAMSALPPGIRQAVISITSALIKRRGGESLVMASLTEDVSRKTIGEPGDDADIADAKALLLPFRRAA